MEMMLIVILDTQSVVYKITCNRRRVICRLYLSPVTMLVANREK